MAHVVLNDCYLSIDSIDLSGDGTNVALSFSADVVEMLAFGDTYKTRAKKSLDWAFSAEAYMDESTIGALFDQIGEEVAIEVRATSAVVGTDNPSYTGNVVITSFKPIDGAFGDAQKVAIEGMGSGAPTRATA